MDMGSVSIESFSKETLSLSLIKDLTLLQHYTKIPFLSKEINEIDHLDCLILFLNNVCQELWSFLETAYISHEKEHSKIESNLLISIWNSLIVGCEFFCCWDQNVFPEKSNRSQNASPLLVNLPVCTYRSLWQHFIINPHGQVSHITSQSRGPFWY